VADGEAGEAPGIAGRDHGAAGGWSGFGAGGVCGRTGTGGVTGG